MKLTADTRARLEPVANGKAQIDRWPRPPAKAAFYGLAGDVVRAIEPHSEADPVALLIQTLVAFGNAVGRGPGFGAEADFHATNNYAVMVGETSKGRKGASWGQIRGLIEQAADPAWGEERVQTGLSSGEGLIWAVRDEISKQTPVKEKGKITGYQEEVTDPGVDDKRLLVLQSEFASTLRVMGREGSTLSPTIRDAWDRGTLRTMTKNSPAKATGAHISIIGHITRDELRRRMDGTEAANGFGNRFLWACVKRSKVLPEGGEPPEVELGLLVERLKDAMRFAQSVELMKRDDDARAVWHDIYADLSDGGFGLVGAVTSRAEAQTMRLACLYALMDESSEIRVEHLEAALALWNYCEASCQYVFGDATGDPEADTILSALRSAPAGLTRTVIRDLFGRHKRGTEIDRALGTLLSAPLVSKEITKTGGRPEERWFALSSLKSLSSQQDDGTSRSEDRNVPGEGQGFVDVVDLLGSPTGDISDKSDQRSAS